MWRRCRLDAQQTVLAEVPISEGPGTVIGDYKLLQKLGEGGFGVVYMAEQTEPVLRRVALKIIKLGMDTKQVVGRFEAERQALAMMEHPNIAKVLAAGSTDTGRPYFVMELVRGIPITDYCDQNGLATNQLLELCMQVWHAVQHAHQKGIIHRDLKPSNVLVTLHDGVPVPKVIDFGIAKATQQKLTDKTVFTQLQQFVGTPAYMSPEQAEMSGLDIDTRSDIYSLGVLLYELLVGRTPFDARELMQSGVDEMRRIIREREPMKPSTRLSLTLSSSESPAPSAPRPSSLSSDLDWIVMKCLEKDRTRRYETATGLAEDLKRHLNNELIQARPPSRLYRFQKMVRRNKAAASAVTSILIALVVGLGVATTALMREREAVQRESAARDVAEQERQAAEEQRREADMQRQMAKANEERARRFQYAADLQLARLALEDSNLGLAMKLLESHIPSGDETDLRGWEWRYIWSQLRSDALVSNRDSDTPVTSISVSPDGALIAVGRMWGTVEILNAHTLKTLHTLQGEWESGDGANVAFMPNSNLLAAQGGLPTEITLWDVNNWTARWSFSIPRAPGRYFTGLASSPHGKRLATHSKSGVLRVLSVETSGVEHEIPGFANDSAFSPDGRLLAASGSQDRILIIDLDQNNGRLEITMEQDVNSLAFSPDGSILAVGSNSQITLLDSMTGDPLGELDGHSPLVFGDDGKTLISKGADQTIQVRDLESGEITMVLKESHSSDGKKMVLRDDGRTLVSKDADQALRVWDLESGELSMILKGSLDQIWGGGIAAVGDTDQVVTGCYDGTVSLWRLSVPSEHTQVTFQPNIRGVATFSGLDGKMIAVNRDGDVVQGDWRHPQRLKKLEALGDENSRRISWCPEKQVLAVYSGNQIKVWSPQEGIMATPLHEGRWPRSRAFIDGGALFVRIDADFELAAWETETWKRADDRIQVWKRILEEFRQNEDRRGLTQGFKVSPDERQLAMWTRKGSVVWYDLKDGTLLADERCHRQWAVGFAFSPDGKFAASCSTGTTVVLWQTEPLEIIETIKEGGVKAGFSPDSKRLVTGNYGGVYKIWDVETHRHLLTLTLVTGRTGSRKSGFSRMGTGFTE